MHSTNLQIFTILISLLIACQPRKKQTLPEDILTSLGNKFKTEYTLAAENFTAQIANDSLNVEAYLGVAETNIILYIFGFTSREETIPIAQQTFQKVSQLDSLSSRVHALSGKLNLLDWNWTNSKRALQRAIKADPRNLDARHWYSLYLSAMGRFEEAMAQSDTIMSMDPGGDYLIGRGSLLYFARRNEEMKDFMLETIAKDTTVPWGYDWLGMAYIELEEFDNSIDIYFKAFEMSDGTVEVGAGLGHALGLAGKYDLAKQMADYYALAAQDHYLPPVQRSFIHIGIGEYDEAMRLLEQAYAEHSWFLVFIQIEPWYDPIRKDPRFTNLIKRMKFPD
jgi:tetratricopeptide (TPR) repeat protein